MNWPVIIIIGIAAFLFIGFLVYRNSKDKTELENKLKQDYRKPRDDEGDAEIEEAIKCIS